MSPSKHQVVIWILGTLIFEHFYKLEDALITSEMSLKSEHMLLLGIACCFTAFVQVVLNKAFQMDHSSEKKIFINVLIF